MPDEVSMFWLPLTSVVATAVVALGSTFVTWQTASAARSHERRLAHDARTWDARSDMLLAMAALTAKLRTLLDFEDRTDPVRTAQDLRAILNRMQGDLAGVVELYASPRLRAQVDRLRKDLGSVQFDSSAWERVRSAYAQKVSAIDAGDFERAANARAEEVQLLRELGLDPTAGGTFRMMESVEAVSIATRRDMFGDG